MAINKRPAGHETTRLIRRHGNESRTSETDKIETHQPSHHLHHLHLPQPTEKQMKQKWKKINKNKKKMADTAKHLPDRQRPSATFVCLVSKKPRKTMAIGRDQVPIKSSTMWSRERDRDRCGPRRSFYWGPTRSRGRHWFFQEGPTIKNQMTSSTTVQTRRKKTESTTNKTHPFFLFYQMNQSESDEGGDRWPPTQRLLGSLFDWTKK